MRKYFIVATTFAVLGVAVSFISTQPVGAFAANQNGVAKAATTMNATIEVKRSPHKGRPPGWSHGRKMGWHGRGRPPGQI
jgi:hypothetical protein